MNQQRPITSLLLSLFCIVLFVTGCATINVFDEKGEDIGIEFYPAKPYLLIESTKEGLQAKVITLPDVTRPHRIEHQGGIGAVEFSVQLSGGMLTSVNQKTDSKVPETITAFSSLVSSIGTLGVAGAAPGTSITILRKPIQDLAADLESDVVIPLETSSDSTLQAFGSALRIIKGELDKSAVISVSQGDELGQLLKGSNETIRESVKKAGDVLKKLKAIALQPNQPASVVAAAVSLETIIGKLNAESGPTKSLSLYEIVPGKTPGSVQFVPVTLPGF
jgi:hypothetical protein